MKRRRFGLGLKMGAGFGILLIIMIILGGVAIWRMRGVQGQAIMLDREYIAEIELSDQLQQAVLQTMYNMRGYGLSENVAYLEEAQKYLSQVKQTLEESKTLVAKAPHLISLKKAIPEIEAQVVTYENLVTQTVESNTQIAKVRETLDSAASQYMQNCYEYSQEQNGSLHTEVIADMPSTQLITRQRQITLVNDVIDLGNATRVETFKAQALRNPERIREALKNFDLIEQKLEQLRSMSYLEENLTRLDNIKAAAQTYRTAMNDLLTNWTALEKLGQQRDSTAQAIIEQIHVTGDKGIEETKKIANAAVSTFSSTSLLLIIGFLGAIVVGAAVALILTRNIVNPMQQGVAFARAIAGGNLNAAMTIRSDDEIGMLAGALQDTRNRIQSVLKEMGNLIQAIREGRLDTRGNADAYEGGWRELLVGMNGVIDAFMTPFNVTAEYLDRIAKGDIPNKISEAYKGDFVEVINNLNQSIDAINGLVAETTKLTEVAVQGRFDIRGNVESFSGDYAAIVEGMNNTIATLVGHINRIPVPVMIIDPEFTIRYINQAGADLLGLSGVQLIGQKCYDHFKTSDCRTANCACARAIESGNIETGETEAHPVGKDLLVSYTGIPIQDQTGAVIGALEILMDQTEIKQAMSSVQQQNWLRTGQAELSNVMRGEQDVTDLAKNVITYLADYLQADIGTLYLAKDVNGNKILHLAGSHAYTRRKANENTVKVGEGLAGQAAKEQESVLYSEIPEDYLPIKTEFGYETPQNLLITPFLYEGELKGVIEVGTTSEFTDTHMEFLKQASENIAVAFNSAQTRLRMQELLEQSQQ